MVRLRQKKEQLSLLSSNTRMIKILKKKKKHSDPLQPRVLFSLDRIGNDFVECTPVCGSAVFVEKISYPDPAF